MRFFRPTPPLGPTEHARTMAEPSPEIEITKEDGDIALMAHVAEADPEAQRTLVLLVFSKRVDTAVLYSAEYTLDSPDEGITEPGSLIVVILITLSPVLNS